MAGEAALRVEMVAADRVVWSGRASMVIARTVDGDVGVLPGHAPMLALLAEAAVEIQAEEETVHAAVDGGFISVAADRVSILSEHAIRAEDIDTAEEQAELEQARGLDADDDRRAARIRRAEARIRAAEKV